MSYATGYGVGAIVVLFLAVLGLYLSKKNNGKNTGGQYDERQLNAQGRAYKAAFFTLMIANFFASFMFEHIEKYICASILFFLITLISLLVYVEYCIFNDAYVSVDSNLKKTLTLVGGITILNFAVGFLNFSHKGNISLTDNDSFTSVINLLLGVLLLIVFISLLIKRAIDSKEN